MADEAASLLVRITGDASDLERTITSVAKELEGLSDGFGDVSRDVQKGMDGAADSISDSSEKIEAAAEKTEDATAKTKNNTKAVKENGEAHRKTAKNLIESGKSMKELGDDIDTATKPLQRLSLITAAGGVACAKFAMDFEDNFASVEKTVDGTPKQLEKIKQGLIDLSTVGVDGRNALPVDTEELTELAAMGGQLEIATDNIVEFTEIMAQLNTATNLVGEEGAATLARFMNVMQVPQTEVRNIGSAVVDLGNNMATTEAEIMEMSNRMGKYGNTVKIGAADVMGYSAALSSLGVEAQLGGSAVGRTWLAIESAVAQGGSELEAFAKRSGKSAEEFKEQWSEDASGAFQDLLKGLHEAENLTTALDELGINNTQDIQAIMSMATNYDLVTEALERSNRAYKENNALQTEADKKAETTAAQWQITKNNLVEAGRSLGETFLPSLKSASSDVSGFAQKLASMSDGQKKTVIGVGATVTAMGAAAKGTASLLKTTGELKEAFGKLGKKGISLGSVIKGLSSPAGIAVAAIGALTVAGVAAYKAWDKATYDWADGMHEQSEVIGETADKVVKLNSLKKEIADLKLIVRNPNSSAEEIETARTRLGEIADLCESDYDLEINVDIDDIDNALEKIEKAVKLIDTKERATLTKESNEFISDIYDNADKYAEAKSRLEGLYADKDKYSARNDFISSIAAEAEVYESKYEAGLISEKKYVAEMKKLAREANNSGLGFNFTDGDVDNYGADIFSRNANNAKYALDTTEKAIQKTKKSIDEFDESSARAAENLQKVLVSDVTAGNNKNISNDIEQFKELGTAMKASGADTDELAVKFAAAKSGFTDFDQAVQNGKADEMAQSYMDFKKSIGESTSESIKGAALIKNGFGTVEDAVGAGDDAVKNVVKSLKELAEDEGVDVTSKKLSKMAKDMELIPEYAKIKINADGDIEIIDKLQNAVEKINATENVKLTVNADGDVTQLETVDEFLQENWDNQLITIKFNADTSGFDIFDLKGNKAGEITKKGTIEWGNKTEELSEDEKTEEAEIHYKPKVEKPSKKDLNLKGTITYSAKVAPNAKGTDNFSGGLAMVNDERGVADPRELVIDKGRAFIPDGKDVILPLSKGAKVYTAKQTKDLLNGMGIPKYAGGKDNSDAFTAAREDWNHYTATHAVSVSEELEKWVELSKEYKSNAKDIADIEEEIYSFKRKQNDEQNKASESYINIRTQLNDWDAYGDDPLSAYKRIETRNLENVDNGLMTKSEFDELMTGFADDMLNGRIDRSFDWLDREQKYNNLSEDEYIAGIDRMIAYTNESLEDTAVSEETYNQIMANLTDKRRDHEIKRAEEVVSAWEKSADNWLGIRETFDDWDDVGDSKSSFYMRSLQSIEELYQSGNLEWDEYMDKSQEAYLNYYKAEEERKDKELDEFRDLIDETEKMFAEEEQALRDSWTVEDRETDMAETDRLLGIYENAVTESGQKRYKELLEQKKELEREEELYELEQEHNAALEELEEEYENMEKEKKKYLKSLRTDQFNIYKKTGAINTSVDGIKSSVESDSKNTATIISQLEDILKAVSSKKTSSGSITYNDNRTNTDGVSQEEFNNLVSQMTGTVITGSSGITFVKR